MTIIPLTSDFGVQSGLVRLMQLEQKQTGERVEMISGVK